MAEPIAEISIGNIETPEGRKDALRLIERKLNEIIRQLRDEEE